MDWLRAHVARFCDGPDHARRRGLILAELQRVSPVELQKRVRDCATEPGGHVRILADCLGLRDVSSETVAAAAAAYLPPAPVTAEADRAVVELVAACGGVPDEATAARISILIQACASTAALVANARPFGGEDALDRALAENPPVRRTCRMVDGVVTEVDIAAAGLPFGAGPHECPGRAHALALAGGVLEGSR